MPHKASSIKQHYAMLREVENHSHVYSYGKVCVRALPFFFLFRANVPAPRTPRGCKRETVRQSFAHAPGAGISPVPFSDALPSPPFVILGHEGDREGSLALLALPAAVSSWTAMLGAALLTLNLGVWGPWRGFFYCSSERILVPAKGCLVTRFSDRCVVVSYRCRIVSKRADASTCSA
jgi:hypothetical protein